MFFGCTSVIKSPTLKAETLVGQSYYQMFYNCSSLTGVTCLATSISATSCLYQWMRNVPNVATSIFYKNASMNDWPRTESGIPSNWTVEND